MSETEFTKEFYIEPEFAWLAGPYDTTIKSNQRMLDRVLKDMVAGGIEHRVVEDRVGRSVVERKGMILSKR
jgi:hypothetical protein